MALSGREQQRLTLAAIVVTILLVILPRFAFCLEDDNSNENDEATPLIAQQQQRQIHHPSFSPPFLEGNELTNSAQVFETTGAAFSSNSYVTCEEVAKQEIPGDNSNEKIEATVKDEQPGRISGQDHVSSVDCVRNDDSDNSIIEDSYGSNSTNYPTLGEEQKLDDVQTVLADRRLLVDDKAVAKETVSSVPEAEAEPPSRYEEDPAKNYQQKEHFPAEENNSDTVFQQEKKNRRKVPTGADEDAPQGQESKSTATSATFNLVHKESREEEQEVTFQADSGNLSSESTSTSCQTIISSLGRITTTRSCEGEEEDDRSLLDVFGELSKEYLTQRVIPDTDEECRWDWRSLRCEPACECLFEGKWGDYHLGRACRLHNLYSSNQNHCVPVDPAVVLKEAPVPKRIISLVSQTIDILTTEVHRFFQRFRNRIIRIWGNFQESMCRETWDLADRLVLQHEKRLHDTTKNYGTKNNQKNVTCIPASVMLTLHATRTFWERTLCGPPQEYPICESSSPPSSSTAVPPQRSFSNSGYNPPHQFHHHLG